MFSKELFGKRIMELRKSHQEKQPILADLLGVSVGHISEIERGNRTTSPERIALLCEHYHVSADYLLGLTDDPEPRWYGGRITVGAPLQSAEASPALYGAFFVAPGRPHHGCPGLRRATGGDAALSPLTAAPFPQGEVAKAAPTSSGLQAHILFASA